MSNKTRSTNGAYELGGTPSNTSRLVENFLRFNLSQECLPTWGSSFSESQEDKYLFTGDMLQPGVNNSYADMETPKWTKTWPLPAMNLAFDANSASVHLSGLFYLQSRGSSYTRLVGVLDAEFKGDIDKLRSDELVLGESKPVWTPTLGFNGQPLGDEETNEGTRQGVGKWLFPLSLLVFIVYVAS